MTTMLRARILAIGWNLLSPAGCLERSVLGTARSTAIGHCEF